MYRDIELESGLNRLRYSFGLYALAIAITWIPLVGTIGSLLALVALILLIMGWRALGRSNLNGANRYHSTSNILIATVVFGFIVIVIGLIMAAVAFVATIPPGSPPANPANLSVIPGFESLLTNILIVAGVGLVIVFLGQLKSALSMRELSKEISEPRVGTAGNLLILSFALSAIAFVAIFSILPELISSLSSASGVPSQASTLAILFSGNLIEAGLLSIVGVVFFVIACAIGYLGLNGAHSKLAALRFSTPSGIYPPSPPPPLGNPSNVQSARYCGACGNKVDSGASFCTNCGARV